MKKILTKHLGLGGGGGGAVEEEEEEETRKEQHELESVVDGSPLHARLQDGNVTMAPKGNSVVTFERRPSAK